MKKRFGLFVNLATLVLCVCAIAIGVYSAKTASLKVSGSVGFIVHDCEVGVVANLYGFGKNADATSFVAKDSLDMRTKSWTKLTGNASETNSWEFSNTTNQIYFVEDLSQATAKAYDVTLELNITNLSAFKISAKLNFSTMFPTDEISVKVYQGTTDTTGVEIANTDSTAQINLGTAETDKIGIIKVVYTLKVDSTTNELYQFESKNLGVINVAFKKLSAQYQHNIIFNDMTFGQNNGLSMTIINNDETNYTDFSGRNSDNNWQKALANSTITFNSSSLILGFPNQLQNSLSESYYNTLNLRYNIKNKDINMLRNLEDPPLPPGYTEVITSIESCLYDEDILNTDGTFCLILNYNQNKTAIFSNINITSDTVTEI